MAVGASAAPLARERVFALLYFLSIAALAVWIVLRPLPRWDLLGYAGAALSWDNTDAATIHAQAYREIQQHLPAAQYQDLIESEPYRRDMARDAALYVQQIPYYNVRPLYVLPLYILHRAGIDFVTGVGLLAALAYFVIGLVAFAWLRRYVGTAYGAILAGLLMFSGPLIMSAKLMTADLLSAAFIVSSMYALIELRALSKFALLMLAALYVRPDNLLLIAPLLLYLYRLAPREWRLSTAQATGFALVCGVSYIAIDQLAGYYGWSSLFYHTFIAQVSDPAAHTFHIGVSEYLYALKTRGGSIFATSIAAFLFAGACGYYLTRFDPDVARRRLYRAVIVIVASNIPLRFIFFPVLWDRMFVAHDVLFAILFVVAAQRAVTQRHPAAMPASTVRVAAARK